MAEFHRPCRLCPGPPGMHALIDELRRQGAGYKRVWQALATDGWSFSRQEVQIHCGQCLSRDVMTAIGDAEDRGVEVDDDFFTKQGIELPPEGVQWVAATVEQRGPDGEKHWVRIKPEDIDEDRVEIRQAQPVKVQGRRPGLTILVPGDWQTWVASPDAQIGYWKDFSGAWHTIHDERCFDLGHQIAQVVAREGIHGWLDVGDFMDLAAPSRHNPTTIDLHVDGLNMSLQRASEELARRRWLVGEDGELVIMGGNHDIRLPKATSERMPYLVGLRRAGDPADEHPVLSVPYLVRARDYGVEWVSGYPSVWRALNSNLVTFHAPAYGSKALDTARKIAARVHASVIHGHTHRREGLAENIETIKGARTLEIWSDGTWARVDGSLPAHNTAHDDYMNRITAQSLPENQGLLGPNMHQGMSILHVEVGGRERFSVERIAFWDGFAQFRGQTFEATCDVEGDTQAEAA